MSETPPYTYYHNDTNVTKYINRLVQEWLQYTKIIIAIDYDDTVRPWKMLEEEDILLYKRIIQLLITAKMNGAYVVAFTSCEPGRYDEIRKYFSEKGLKIDSINENPITLPYGPNPSAAPGQANKKVYANIYIDDRAGLLEALHILETAMYRVVGHRIDKQPFIDIA